MGVPDLYEYKWPTMSGVSGDHLHLNAAAYTRIHGTSGDADISTPNGDVKAGVLMIKLGHSCETVQWVSLILLDLLISMILLMLQLQSLAEYLNPAQHTPSLDQPDK